MSVLADLRPDSWNFPLFVHVLGAMVLVGGLLTGASALAYARGEARFLRLGYWTLLGVALPAWIVMRVGAEWIYSKGWDEVDPEPDWVGVGYITSEAGGLALLIALVVGGIGVRKLRDGKGQGLFTATLVLTLLALTIFVVAAWAMSGKPG